MNMQTKERIQCRIALPIIIGILSATVVGIPFGVTDLSVLKGEVPGISWKFWENFGDFFAGDNSVFFAVAAPAVPATHRQRAAVISSHC